MSKIPCPHCGSLVDAAPPPPPSPRFLVDEESLVDALVVDSEGYICGRVHGARYEEDEVYIDVYKYVEQRFTGPDYERLKAELLKTLPWRPWRPRSERELEERVRRELRLPPTAPITERELCEYAKLKGLPIPTKVYEHRDRKVVYSLSLKQVETIGVSGLGACVLLKEPIEATRLNIQPSSKVPFKSTEQVKGKLTIDAAGRILGRAQKVLLGETLILRVDLEDYVVRKVPDVDLLLSRYYSELRDSGSRRPYVNVEQLVEWARREGVEVPYREERRLEKVGELDVRWSDIRKIGDVILLSRRLEELRQPKP
ncbi:hypothetical protein B6U99_05175 [Candidatus Geothermarchaeota archaeon ex4572_27]|nr:MAG: hypothetical protein B6U99_05175 [Candidatus Geothermarchaeota archaeon ex4572_27]